jgi:hypothetical protein
MGDSEFNRSAILFDYTSQFASFDAVRAVSVHILRMLYISAALYIEGRIG